jgi:hypothetical protein
LLHPRPRRTSHRARRAARVEGLFSRYSAQLALPRCAADIQVLMYREQGRRAASCSHSQVSPGLIGEPLLGNYSIRGYLSAQLSKPFAKPAFSLSRLQHPRVTSCPDGQKNGPETRTKEGGRRRAVDTPDRVKRHAKPAPRNFPRSFQDRKIFRSLRS